MTMLHEFGGCKRKEEKMKLTCRRSADIEIESNSFLPSKEFNSVIKIRLQIGQRGRKFAAPLSSNWSRGQVSN